MAGCNCEVKLAVNPSACGGVFTADTSKSLAVPPLSNGV